MARRAAWAPAAALLLLSPPAAVARVAAPRRVVGASGRCQQLQDTYYSEEMRLAPGEMVFTKPETTPVTMPQGGEYYITGFEGEIVDGETLQSTPLTEIYDHHWILLNNVHKNRLCKGIEYVFGVGAESRNTPFDLPAGYGYPVAEGTEWGANIHLLRTEGLEGEDPYLAVKHCNECFYAPGKGDACNRQSNGTFQCCGDSCATGKTGKQSCKCPTAKGVSTERKGYKLKYTLNYTTGCDLEPVDIGVLAAPDCAAFYHVQRNNAEPVTVASAELSIDGAYDVVAATGHQHVGAVNLSVSVNGRLVCASYPTYGNQKGVAGDELGYLTHMSQCIGTAADAYTEGPLQLSKGDKLRVDGYYFVGDNDERIAPSKGGTHLNVMSYLYAAFAARGSSEARAQ